LVFYNEEDALIKCPEMLDSSGPSVILAFFKVGLAVAPPVFNSSGNDAHVGLVVLCLTTLASRLVVV
jgi:hypothetical protein